MPSKSYKKFILKQILLAAVLVLLVSILGLVINFLRPDSMPLFQNWGEKLAKETAKKLPGGALAVEFDEMAASYQKKAVLVLDARPFDFYQLEHIPGAKSCPSEEADKYIPEVLAGVSKDFRIVVYCEGGACRDSLDLAQKLISQGWTNVSVYLGGMMEWMDNGMPLVGEGI